MDGLIFISCEKSHEYHEIQHRQPFPK